MASLGYRSRAHSAWNLSLKAFSVLVLLFLVAPILVIVPLSFNSGSFFTLPPEGFSLRWYAAFFGNSVWLRAIGNSLLVGVVAALAATVLGTLAAIGLVRSRSRVRNVLLAALILPLVVPLVITAVAMFLIFAKWGLVGNYAGIMVAHTALVIPFVIISVVARLQGFNQNLPRAAQSLGASPVRAFFSVTFPLLLPGILAGSLFAFAVSLDEIVVTLFLASPAQRTLPLQMYAGIRQSITPTVTAAATILIALAVVLMFFLEFLRRNERYKNRPR